MTSTAAAAPSVADLIKAAAEARQRGDKAAAVDHLTAALRQHEQTRAPVPRTSYYDLGVLLYELRRYEEAETWVRSGLARRSKDFALTNLLGVLQKRQGRFDEALKTLDQAAKLDGTSVSPYVNRGNIYLEYRDGARAAEMFKRAVRMQPRSAENQRLLGLAYQHMGDFAKALNQFEIARQINPQEPRIWIDQAAVFEATARVDEAFATLDRAIDSLGPVRNLIEARIVLLRRAGRYADARAWIETLLKDQPEAAWLHFQMGRTLIRMDRKLANVHFAEAVRLAPDEPQYVTEYAENADRTRGPEEADNIAIGYRLALRRLEMGANLKPDAKTLRSILVRCGDYEAADRLGTFEELGTYWAAAGEEAALHHMMGQVRSSEQKRALVDYHKTWGRSVDLLASKTPLNRTSPEAPAITGQAKIRLGFMSSDLRAHPVAYFAYDLLTGYDRERFEIYCYSWSTHVADGIQNRIAAAVHAFRHHPHIADRDAAQLIADDHLDVLFELGGSTDMNKLKVMAWRPAPRQASWLGYPHSCGLTSIDRILVDPFIKPDDPSLLIEKPFELKRTWVAMDKPGFSPIPAITPETPTERNGFVTFGTMNNPYKYNPRVLATWAEILQKVPDSTFLFVRPEGAVPAFRENIERRFESLGVAPDRIHYVPVRGTHLQHYNEIDVALDTFPHVGGTTTCETLWMGVPTVTLVGEAFFERLSYSNLNNAGLGDLCTFDVDGYVAKAIEVGADVSWRSELRRTMGERLKSHPLGQPDRFTEDFQEAVVAWLDEARP
jgi:predicted O-linked N-acetylglucosamine transferase (SPINDLY family)